MTADAALQTLFDNVRRTLTDAGFDVAVADSEEQTGLLVRIEAEAVVISWTADEAPGAHTRGHESHADLFTEYHGIRKALREALLAVLLQAGHAAFSDRDSEVRVARA
ncbi:hypothetical protein ACFXJ5_33485 [Streptomyces sp. NPDC059373]